MEPLVFIVHLGEFSTARYLGQVVLDRYGCNDMDLTDY